jgi:hypothetical protein
MADDDLVSATFGPSSAERYAALSHDLTRTLNRFVRLRWQGPCEESFFSLWLFTDFRMSFNFVDISVCVIVGYHERCMYFFVKDGHS